MHFSSPLWNDTSQYYTKKLLEILPLRGTRQHGNFPPDLKIMALLLLRKKTRTLFFVYWYEERNLLGSRFCRVPPPHPFFFLTTFCWGLWKMRRKFIYFYEEMCINYLLQNVKMLLFSLIETTKMWISAVKFVSLVLNL